MMQLITLTESRVPLRWGVPLLALLLVAVTAVVYLAGGTRTVYPHLYYVLIVAGALLYHLRGGIGVALLAGLLCGPLMPLDAQEGVAQAPEGWLVRLGMFTLIGLLAGAGVEALQQRIGELRRHNAEVILSFVQTIDAKCPYTAQHSHDVARYAVLIAHQLGFDRAAVEHVRWAALLHDIGKLRVPDAILNKPGSLTPDEWQVIRQHPLDAVRMLEGIHSFHAYLPAIRYHHERLDGAGYPDGLAGPEIPIEARILAVADAYDAMVSQRPYRPPLGHREALRRLREGAGRQFDSEIVAALEAALARETLPAPQAVPGAA